MNLDKPTDGIPEMDFEIKFSFWPDKLIKRFFKRNSKMKNKTLVEIALAEFGTKEVKGSQHNMDIVNYAKEAGFAWVNDDETPWCSIFLSWIALKAGLERSKKANARSWLSVGTEVITPEIGDIVVFWRNSPDSWQGHVGIFINEENGSIRVLGGNQGDQVNITMYSKKHLLGYRRLNKA